MPVLSANSFDFYSHSPEQTRRLGMRLGEFLHPGDVICLQGDLGAGKTTFVQGIAAGWGSLDDVSSPTFVLVNVYRKAQGAELYHFDTYRVESALEAEELDLDDMLSKGPLVIEWPERLLNILPEEKLWIKLEYIDENLRKITFIPGGDRHTRLLEEFRRFSFGSH